MNITREELEAAGVRHAGTVHPDVGRILRVQIDWDVSGFVVYIMVVNHEFKKAGKTGDGKSTFKQRWSSEFHTIRQVITGAPEGRPAARWRSRPLDPFKEHAPAAILANQEVELWAKKFPSREEMLTEEQRLNDHYLGEWTKEGRRSTRS